MANPAEEVLAAVIRDVLAPRERPPVDEWADAHRRLVPEGSNEAGPWRTDRVPYAREPMREFSGHGVDEIALMWASQTGKTDTISNMIGWVVDCDPAPIVFVWPNVDRAADYNTQRLMPTVVETPRLKARLRGVGHGSEAAQSKSAGKASARNLKTLHLKFDRCDVFFRGSGSSINVRSTPAKYRFADEIDSDEFRPGAIGDLRQRADAWPGGKLVKASIPSLEGRGIHAEYLASDQRKYWVPCPHCWHYQVLKFSQLRWEGGVADNTPEHADATAHYICEACEREAKRAHGPHWAEHCPKIHEHHKPWMLQRGVWAKEGQTVVADGRGGYRIEGEPLRPGSRKAGFWISQLYSPFKPWGAIAAEWVELKGEPTPEFVNGVLAEPWTPRGEKTTEHELRRLCIPKDYPGSYALGSVTPWMTCLIGIVDVQADYAFISVFGYGRGAAVRQGPGAAPSLRWGLVWFEERECPRGGGLVELDPVLRWAFPVCGPAGQLPQPPEGEIQRVALWGVDTGHRTVETYDWIRAARAMGLPLIGIKGVGQGNLGRGILPHQISQVDRYPDGRPIPGGLSLFEPSPLHWKDWIYECIGGGPDRVCLPHDCPQTVLEHWTAEHRVDPAQLALQRGKTPPRSVGPYWTLRPGRKRNDAWDQAYYAAALADYFRVEELEQPVWRGPRPAVGGGATGGAAGGAGAAGEGTPRSGQPAVGGGATGGVVIRNRFVDAMRSDGGQGPWIPR